MLTVTDLFAGFGGASTGAVSVPGVELRMAANHWQLAIEVHNTNHPNAARDLMGAVAAALGHEVAAA